MRVIRYINEVADAAAAAVAQLREGGGERGICKLRERETHTHTQAHTMRLRVLHAQCEATRCVLGG